LGDRVWEDENGDGIQNCGDTNNNGIIGDAGDTGPECDAGIEGVKVDLVDCETGDPLAGIPFQTTDRYGFYLFDNLAPGEYSVRFDLDTVPSEVCCDDNPQFTTANVGGDDAVDSDADLVTGVSPPVALGAGETNRTVDAGIVCQECPITIDKKCLVAQPPAGPFDCSDAKPIDKLSMIWDGSQNIRIKAWKGGVGSTLLADIDNIAIGDEVTVTRFGGSPNDVYWEIFEAGTSKGIGESAFHLSCSDDEMDGETDDTSYPQDCGRPQGNGKSNDSTLTNDWLFEGMAGNGLALDCTPVDLTPSDQCFFEASPVPGCKTDPEVSDLTNITFRYTGTDCSASSNNQGEIGDKWDCEGLPGGDDASITVIKDAGKTSSDKATVDVGDTFTLGDDFSSESIVGVGGQTLIFHTSCSQPLAVGDVFGSLEVVGINGLCAVAEVTYFYEVTNIGSDTVDITSVYDDQLGQLLKTPSVELAEGQSLELEETEFISETTTNVVTVTANVSQTDQACGQATDQVTVELVEPTSACDVSIVLDKLEDDKLKYKVTNNGAQVATLATLTVDFRRNTAKSKKSSWTVESSRRETAINIPMAYRLRHSSARMIGPSRM
jgi:hypothetical protein